MTALLLVATTACKKDDDSRILTATLERYNNDSKAYIDEANYACWTNGDKIKINGTIERDITIGASGHSDEATIDVSGIPGDIMAFYPSSNIKDDEVSFPYVQEYNVDETTGYQLIDNPMAAFCPTGSQELRFRNLGALLKVHLQPSTDIQVKAIEVKGIDNQILCGTAKLIRNSNNEPALTQLTNGCSSVVLHFASAQMVPSTTGKDFYIVVPAGTGFNSLTIAVLTTESPYHHCKTSTIGQALSRNHIGAITYTPNGDEDETFTPAWMTLYTGTIEKTPSGYIPYQDGKLISTDGITTIGNNAFKDCATLTSITLPNGVTAIGDNAFDFCTGLTSIVFPNSLTSIGTYAFSNCNSLLTITFPNRLTSIGINAFQGCTKLDNITLPNSLKSISTGVFRSCARLINITLPDGLESIGPQAFYDCDGLRTITIPSSVTSIGNEAFWDCAYFGQMFCLPTTPPQIGQIINTESYIKPTIYVPDEAYNAYADERCPWSTYHIRQLSLFIP